MPDNKRYVGDVFIDGKTDRLLQEFLTNLFNQYNGEGKGFNADMLDGHHYSDIENELLRLDSEKLSTIMIGNSVFNSEQSSGFLHFSDIIYDDYTSLPWRNNIPNNYNITNTLTDLYSSIMNYVDDTKVNKEQVDENDDSNDPRMKVLSDNNFSDTDKQNLNTVSDTVLNSLTAYTDKNGVEHHVLNSYTVNGLRFILITQENYNALKNSSIQTERDYVNSWRNVFIIKDASQMPSEVEYSNPLTYDIKDGFLFRLSNDEAVSSVANDIDVNDPNPIWLQLKHNWETQWTNLIPLQDLFRGVDFSNNIVDVIENNETICFNATALRAVVNEILNNQNSEDYLALNYIPIGQKNQFIHNLIKDDDVLESALDENGFSNVDITNIFDTEFEEIDDKISNISNNNHTGVLDIQINSLNQTLNTLNNQINGSQNDAILQQLSSIKQSLSQLNSNISTINGLVSGLSKYTKYTGTFMNDTSNIYYNDYTKIAYVQIQNTYNHKKAHYKEWVRIGTLPSKFTPIRGLKVPYSPEITVYFRNDRAIFCRIDRNNDISFTLTVGGMFAYK